MVLSPGARPVAVSCYDWDDTRTYHVNGKVLSGHVQDKQTHEIYRNARYNDLDLTHIFQNLVVFQIPYMLGIRLQRRIINLLQGDFIFKGYQQAEHEWLTENSKNSQAWSPHFTWISPPVGYTSLYTNTIIKILWELVKEIAKIVTYPFAMIALEYSALHGVFINPQDGRKMWSSIEYVWSVSDPVDNTDQIDVCLDSLHFLAPCLQPDNVWEERNLFRTKTMYHAGTLRSRMCAIKHNLLANRNFYDQEGLDVKRILKSLEAYQCHEVECDGTKKSYFKACISRSDLDEVSFFECKLRHKEWQRQHALALKQMLIDLNHIRPLRFRLISLQRALTGTSAQTSPDLFAQLEKAEASRTQILSRLDNICHYWQNSLPVFMHRAMNCKNVTHDTLRIRIRAISQQLHIHREIFEEEGLNVQHLFDGLQIYLTYKAPTDKITFFKKAVTSACSAEVDELGILRHTPIQEKHGHILEQLSRDLDIIRTHRETILEFPKTLGSEHSDTARMQHIANAESNKKHALARLEALCNYWKTLLPLDMHTKMGCKGCDHKDTSYHRGSEISEKNGETSEKSGQVTG